MRSGESSLPVLGHNIKIPCTCSPGSQPAEGVVRGCFERNYHFCNQSPVKHSQAALVVIRSENNMSLKRMKRTLFKTEERMKFQ